MCFGGGPQAPKIQYKGPSAADIEAQRQALDQYKAQMAQQQTAFQSQLQDQIDAANDETVRLQQQYDADAAAAAASASAQQGSYAVTATQSVASGGQTTAAVAKKEKPKSSLKISTAALPTEAGAGLNIGV
jgi:hypothetical protein